MKRNRSNAGKTGFGAQAMKQLAKILGTSGPEDQESKKRVHKRQELKRRKRLQNIGDLGEFNNNQIALHLAILLFEGEDSKFIFGSDWNLNWKRTSDLYARWCITFILLGDEKSSSGLPSLKVGLERVLFMLELAEECLKLHNVVAARGITHALRHEYIAWLCEFLSKKSSRRLQNLSNRSKKAFAETSAASWKNLNVSLLAARIKELRQKVCDGIESDSSGNGKDEKAEKVSDAKEVCSPHCPGDAAMHSVATTEAVKSSDESESSLLEPLVVEPIGAFEAAMMDRLTLEATMEKELSYILHLQLSRSRTSEELKTLYKAVQANLNLQISVVFRQSGLM